VAVSNGTVVASSLYAEDNKGAAYLFEQGSAMYLPLLVR